MAGFSGWRHPAYGLILFDRTDQDDIAFDNVRVFEMKGKTTRVLTHEVLKSETSAEITDNDFVQVVTAYNILKSSLANHSKLQDMALMPLLKTSTNGFFKKEACLTMVFALQSKSVHIV